MEENIDDIKKLSPEERIKKLKEIETKEEEHLENIRSLIKNSEGELEVKEETKKKFPIPQLRAVDTSPLFGKKTEEQRIFATHHFSGTKEKEEKDDESLENVVGQETETEERDVGRESRENYSVQQFVPDYSGHRVRYMPLEVIQERVYNLNKSLRYDTLTGDQKEQMFDALESIAQGVTMKNTDIESGKYNINTQTTITLSTLSRWIEEMRDSYR